MTLPKVQIPNRFEGLLNMVAEGAPELGSIVKPVKSALDAIDTIFDDMTSSGQGAFLVLEGPPGSGKSTFLHTIKLFREGVRTIVVDTEQSINEALLELKISTDRLRIVVLAGREALVDISESELDLSLHAINQFIRSREGRNTIVVWPCTTDNAVKKIVAKANAIGGDALLGVCPSGYQFEGPPKAEYVAIARNTIEALNGGASLIALGVTDERATELAATSPTLGAYLKSLREEERRNRATLANLLPTLQRTMLWIVVIAGNDPETDVGTLTYGADFSADVTRLLASSSTATESIAAHSSGSALNLSGIPFSRAYSCTASTLDSAMSLVYTPAMPRPIVCTANMNDIAVVSFMWKNLSSTSTTNHFVV